MINLIAMAGRYWFPGISEVVNGVFRPGISTKGPIGPRIRVIEKPGADFEAPDHMEGSGSCWCCPDTYFDEEEGSLCVVHRMFDN